MSELKRTPLFEAHKRLGAKFTGFGGWEMPVRYSGLVNEHLTVRNAVGLFDVSHMGELTVGGPRALEFLQHVTTNDLKNLVPGKAQYNLLLNERGGVVDDIIVYLRAPEKYLLCVNAANTEKDFEWLKSKNTFGADLKNVSAEYAQIAVQGPRAEELVENLFGLSAGALSQANVGSFSFVEKELKHPGRKNGPANCIIARTGYTGEDGFEVFCPSDAGELIWELLLERGERFGVKPAGLGARDTLRLEVCYPLHGHEITDDLTPFSAGLGWVVKLGKGDFIGRSALEEQQRVGIDPVLVGLEVTGAGIIRTGTPLFEKGSDSKLGWVTSGTKPPTVNKPIGLGFVPAVFSTLGSELEAEVRGRRFAVKVIKKPFYRR